MGSYLRVMIKFVWTVALIDQSWVICSVNYVCLMSSVLLWFMRQFLDTNNTILTLLM